MKKTDIVLDFDGTCVKHKYPDIGESIGAEPVLFRLLQNHCRLILFTMRSGKRLQDAVDWFKDRSIPLFGIQYNPNQTSWTGSPKAYGQVYIDDEALGCPLVRKDGERPWVDWKAVEKELINLGAIRAGGMDQEEPAEKLRQKAMRWWRSREEHDKAYLFEARRMLGWTPAGNHEELTGREIYAIWKIYTNG